MSRALARGAIFVCAVLVVAGAIAMAQDRKTAPPTAAASVDVFNSIEGRMVVLFSRPEGAVVAKGELVCELDASELHDRGAAQDVTVRAAEADCSAATLAREVAELAFPDYIESAYLQQLQNVEGTIKLAESELARAEDQVDWTRRMFDKGYVSLSAKITDELKLKAARFALEQAQSKKRGLVDHTRTKKKKELQQALATAKARELVQEASLVRERSTQKRLNNQLQRCKVTAPTAGRVRYTAPIGPGAVVRDGQLLFTLLVDGKAGAGD
jgi:HlyD family secretion protein